MKSPAESNGATAARFIAAAATRQFDPEVLDAAKMCLVDWCGVALGAYHEQAAESVRDMARDWGGSGAAPILLRGTTTPALSALVNGTMAHCLDFDDTHVGSLAHLSGPTWAVALALGAHEGLSGAECLTSFITGFEVGGRLGNEGFGQALTERGFHSTGVIGKLAATATACAALGLDEGQILSALGLAATQASGLTGSFGTMSKPFHAGKSAMDGVLSAQLAAHGFQAAEGLLDGGDGSLANTMVQDGSVGFAPLELSAGQELLRNTFKPYASCLLTHPAIDAARQLAPDINGGGVERLVLEIHPLASQVAGKPSPATPLEGKFSLAYCVALGLRGYHATAEDFSAGRLADPAIAALVSRLELRPAPDMDKRAAVLDVRLEDGRELHAAVPLALGNPGNPMNWNAMEGKFMALAEPQLAARARNLLEVLRRFEEPGALAEVLALVRGPSA
ncbi:MAG: MmgE/PrpD family protein [SAR324 cluster bacterium]|nr:MmgE/PrpD family protein [SAR324 cluster bacterium]